MTVTRTAVSPNLPSPPDSYVRTYMNELVRNIEIALGTLFSRRRIEATTINVNQLPTSAAGLRSGELWVDTAASFVIKMVP